MKNKTIITIAVIVAVLLLLCVPACSKYNSLVKEQASLDEKWGQVENQYQRRSDLIPNLVETVKGYAKHESTTLQNVTNARVGAAPIDTTGVMQAARDAMNAPDANAYAGSLSRLKDQFSIYVNAVHEAYPDLKANENFARLQDELAGTENRVTFARQGYIEAVKSYNISVRTFPGNIVASIFGFQPREQFEAEPEAKKAPKVEF